ncbi:hypothetical protein A5320_13770 [Rheinheimera sp. SA_1]|uniref:flavin reductase family protein n=1 Tax=Rheinheimera sp. SA_1 TaxID=1827365 RepID=UPI0008007C21|nr:iron-sulfur cluster-binding domain-containing protein [Rheinheimera sp. SA_1]OBP14785.1 hypothetical protein A5320_13770 [Rheinheimera sp. SA_1]
MTLFSTPQPKRLNQQITKKSVTAAALLQQCWRWCCQVALVQPSLLSYLEPLIRFVRPTFRAHLSHAKLLKLQQQGNFLHLTLRPGHRWQGFIPGQHLQLVLEIDGRAVSRTFSISSSLQLFLQQGLITLTIQQQPQGVISNQLQQLLQPPMQPVPVTGSAPKLSLHLSAARGAFTLSQHQPALLLAAGSGITPIHAMLTSISRLTQPLLLIYSYRGADQLLFAASWRELQQKFPLLKVQLIDTQSRGRVTVAEVTAWLLHQPASQVYLCGPASFSQCWQQQLALLPVPASNINQESFGLGAVPSANGDRRPHHITVTLAAQRLTVQSGEGSLLQSLEAAGLDPAYGCRRGICMQCLCQKSQGLVRNLVTGETSDAGPGQIQLCISQPLSAVELSLV